MLRTVSILSYCVLFITFIIIAFNFCDLKKHNEGNEKMVKLSGIIRVGSKTFLKEVYVRIAVTVIILAICYSAFSERSSGLCLIIGAVIVIFGEEIGMRGGTYAGVRTTNAALVTRALSRALRIATLGGSIGGFSLSFAFFGILTLALYCWLSGPLTTGTPLLFPNFESNVMISRLTAYSMGFSIVAIFNRVGGGTYTKSADIANDIVSKGEFHLKEDDPRNVCSIADLIGDCINDLAGNLSDLGESYVATYMSCFVISIQNFSYNLSILESTLAFPIILAIGGLISSVASIMYIILKNRRRYRWIMLDEAISARRDGTASFEILKALDESVTRDGKDGKELRMEYSLTIDNPGRELTNATVFSALGTIAFGLLGARIIFKDAQISSFAVGWYSPVLAAGIGMITSVLVGWLTSIYTDTEHDYVPQIVTMAKKGPSFAVSMMIAIGKHSAFIPMILIGISIFLAYYLCGLYGIAIAAVGVLAFAAETVSIDAFGPIADNAGGIAEACDLDPEIRSTITDPLDAVGNTTAAIGKGNAISAASYSTISMVTAFIGAVPNLDLNSMDSLIRLVSGMFFGGATIYEFIKALTVNTLKAASKLSDEAERQLRIKEVFDRKVDPDYQAAITLASVNAINYMVGPAMLSVFPPLLAGSILGPAAQLGLLLGSTVVAVGEAFFNGNAGGAADNAKKMIEMGLIPGLEKYSEAHLSAIACDMIGDIMKDVVAVCCDICIKIMAVTCTATAAIFFSFHLL